MSVTSPIDRPTAVVLAIASVGVVAWGAFWGWHTVRGWEQLHQQEQHGVTWWPEAETWQDRSTVEHGHEQGIRQ